MSTDPTTETTAEPATDETIRELAERMARKIDVSGDRAEAAVRNLIQRGLIELKAAP
jgi:predicted transcriptional regulator